jgi:hypothetical protein
VGERLDATDAEIQKWFTELVPLPYQGSQARVWFENFELLVSDQKRSPTMAAPERTGPEGMQAVLRERIGPAATYSRAVSFSRLGKKGAE